MLLSIDTHTLIPRGFTVQSSGSRKESKLQDAAFAFSPETVGIGAQHSPQNQLQQPDAPGGWIALEKSSTGRPAQDMGRWSELLYVIMLFFRPDLILISVASSFSGTFNMDTPWLYVYTAHKLNQPMHHTLQLTAELTTSKWLSIRNLILEGLYRDRGREKEARLKLYTPAVTYLHVRWTKAPSNRWMKLMLWLW